MYSYLTEREWNVPHRYSDFYELYVVLSKHHLDVPSIPNRSIGRVTNISELNKRKESLNNFVKEIINRSDLISNVYTIKFLRLDNHFPDFNIFQPLLLLNLENISINHIPTAFHFHKSTSLLFIGLSNTTISGRINNYISKFFTKSKSETTSNQSEYPGYFMIFNLIKNNSGAQHMELIYERGVNSEVTSINFYDTKNILCLGMKNGSISLNKLYINESSSVSKELVDEICTVKSHKSSIVGVCVNFSLGYVYSVARDKTIAISEINYQSMIRTIPITKKDISSFFYDETWSRIFLVDDSGSIWILDILSNPLQPKILQALHNQLVNISILDFDFDKNNLLVGNKSGIVICYELENYNEKIIPQYQNMSNINMKKILEIKTHPSIKIQSIMYTNKNELLIGMSNGSVAVYSHDKTYPEYVIDAHSGPVTGFWWDEDKKMLITASHDKSIKLFQFPIFWPSEIIRKSRNKNKITLIEGSSSAISHTTNLANELSKEEPEAVDEKSIEEDHKIVQVFENFKQENTLDDENGTKILEDLDAHRMQIMKKKKDLRQLNVDEKICLDLDGWDTNHE